MVYTAYVKQRIVYYHTQNLKPPTIQKLLLEEEGQVTTRQGITKFLQIYKRTGLIARCQGSGRPSKRSEAVKEIVEQQVRRDDETTAIQLDRMLAVKGL